MAKSLAAKFRAADAPVILVRISFARDLADAPPANVDEPQRVPPEGLPEDFAEIVDDLARPSDLHIVKRHWGAFYGTELDLQLRRRGIKTIVLGGVATSIGVEGTAREAWQHGYDVVIAEDATASSKIEMHEMSVRHILPRLSRVMQSDGIALTAV